MVWVSRGVQDESAKGLVGDDVVRSRLASGPRQLGVRTPRGMVVEGGGIEEG